MLLVYAAVILAIALVFLVSDWLTQPITPRCECGQPARQIWSDGQMVCSDCAERLLSGKAPRAR